MATIILGGFLFQYPLGWLSDLIGRRKVILLSCISGASISVFALHFSGGEIISFFIIACVGGFALPLYALCGVNINDYLNPTQMVAASGTIVLLSSLGATIGSPLTAAAMDLFGLNAFYGSIAIMLTAIFIFSLWRTGKRPEFSTEETGDFVPMQSSPMSASLNLDVTLKEIETAENKDTEQIQDSFDDLAKDLESQYR